MYHLRTVLHLLNCSPIIFNNCNYMELPGLPGAEICGLISPNYRLSSCRDSEEAAGGSSSSSSKDGINFNCHGSGGVRFDIFNKMRAAYIIYVYIINASRHARQRVRLPVIVIIITRILSRMWPFEADYHREEIYRQNFNTNRIFEYTAAHCCSQTDGQDSGIISDQGHWRVRANAEVQLTR